MDLTQLAKAVCTIAKDAGAVILDIYNTADFGVEQKSDNSPLTRADRDANQVICDGLEALSVKYPIISEENKAIPYAERKDFEYAWLVDPLDGTKEFIKRNGEFTVNIALIHNNSIVLGAVYTPVSDDLYWAVKGEGAYLEKDGKSTKLSANHFSLKDHGLGVVCSRSHLNEATQAFVDGLNEPTRVPKGSSLKFLILAQGGAHVYPRLAPTMEWDTGAAQIVLEEAGGKVIAQDTKAPLQYNKENLLNPYFIAYGAVSEVV
ncbi:MAG: 3'(2'),5'-bisphosphate nucleotidase CysQ [Bacteroidota bacterium]